LFAALAKNIGTLAGQTLWRQARGWRASAVAAAFAIPLAMLIVVSANAGAPALPPMVGTSSIPKIALAPLFIVWFGFGVTPKVAVAFLIAFFPIVIDTIVGLRSIDPAMIQLRALPMGAPSYRIFLKTAASARAAHDLRWAQGRLLLAVVGCAHREFVGSDKGLGYLWCGLRQPQHRCCSPRSSYCRQWRWLFFYLIEVLERIAIPWHASQRSIRLAGHTRRNEVT